MDAASTNNVIAATSALIALIALVTSIWALVLQRKHNRLSAKPIVDVVLGRDECIIEIVNCGLGPALLEGVSASIEGDIFDLMTVGGLDALAVALVGGIGRDVDVTHLRLTAPSPIQPGQVKSIMGLNRAVSPAELRAIRKRLRLLSLTFRYRCIYGILHCSEHAATED